MVRTTSGDVVPVKGFWPTASKPTFQISTTSSPIRSLQPAAVPWAMTMSLPHRLVAAICSLPSGVI